MGQAKRNREAGIIKVVYHYTYSFRIQQILDSNALLPPCLVPNRDASVPDIELVYQILGDGARKDGEADTKLLLFSSRVDWEPASYRGIQTPEGQNLSLISLETYGVYGINCYRIGVEQKRLQPWRKLPQMVGMSFWMQDALEDHARSLGSDPYDWYGTTEAVPASEWLNVEIFDTVTKTWRTATQEDFAKEKRVVSDENGTKMLLCQ